MTFMLLAAGVLLNAVTVDPGKAEIVVDGSERRSERRGDPAPDPVRPAGDCQRPCGGAVRQTGYDPEQHVLLSGCRLL